MIGEPAACFVVYRFEHTAAARQVTGALVTEAVVATKVLAGTSAAVAVAAAAPVVAPLAIAGGIMYAIQRATEKK
ncbi:hypothetical protein DTL42_19685 [Bremerella cremea]|uniref:Uncharacterized protein n=1 Tax=Bremerella cremea TaxID=1031537 RepID=A0A368KLQ2_9BACT|nr:hypothetical protein [Bremerella cremea]RCS42054.1 hypothetical protein DTL42_19685 [Bremerella cremea]